MSLPVIPIQVDSNRQPERSNFTVLQDSDFYLKFVFSDLSFPAGSLVEFGFAPEGGDTRTVVTYSITATVREIQFEVDRAKVGTAGVFLWDLRISVAGDVVAWSFGEMTVRGKAGAGSTESEVQPYRKADVDWTETGNVDVAVPGTLFLLTEILLYTDAANTGASFTLGTDADPDLIIDNGAAFSEVKIYEVSEIITGGVFRLARLVAGSAGENGKVAIRGVDLS